jgi:hypothetical protein
MLSLDTAYRSFGGEVEASSTPTICRLSDSRRHQNLAIALRSRCDCPEAYDLECVGRVRSLYLEIPREEFSSRFNENGIPVAATMATGRGLGRIAAEFCSMLASERSPLEETIRTRLGDELMDVLALALDMGNKDDFSEDATAQKARLRSVKPGSSSISPIQIFRWKKSRRATE